MPAITTTIDRDQREGLYELVRNHLGSIEDFWVALERTKDFAKAEQLGVVPQDVPNASYRRAVAES